jgi:serine kinase of HPr protein (carbohydrate metabolism regulator)
MKHLHGTAVALNGFGVLIRGPSGSGKSDLALRLIGGGAELIADDQVIIKVLGEKPHISAPAAIRGLIEVRGLGVVNIGAVNSTPLCLIVNLKLHETIERMPEIIYELCEGFNIATIDMNAFTISAPEKIKMALGVQSGKVKMV